MLPPPATPRDRDPAGAARDAGAGAGDADGPAGRRRGVVLIVVAIAAVGLLARVVGLGDRPFHWGEARVGYWSLRFAASGAFEYRPVAGGPFLYVVDRWVFATAGASDATARAVVAAIGGLLPLVALAYRRWLGGTATVALAALLAFDPLLVYYSRFLRGEVPLVAAGLLAVAAAWIALADGDRRATYAAAVAAAVALATSGFAVVTVACWLVAGVLVLDHGRLLQGVRPADARPVTDGGSNPDSPPDDGSTEPADPNSPARPAGSPVDTTDGDGRVRPEPSSSAGPDRPTDGVSGPTAESHRDGRGSGTGRPKQDAASPDPPGDRPEHRTGPGHSETGPTVRDLRTAFSRLGSRTLARAFLLAAATLVVFFAPRAGSESGPGLFRPTTLPAVLEATFAGSARKFLGVHVLQRSQAGATHELLPYVADYGGTMLAASLPLVALALVGFLADRYGGDGPTPVVAFHAYWGFATLLAVPVAAEVSAPWLAVLGIAPLAVPAAVGAARVVSVGRRAWRRADAATVAAVGLVLLSAGVHAGAVAAADVYAAPTADSRLAQYAQPTDLDPVLANVSAATAADGDAAGAGSDVVYVGGDLSATVDGDARQPPVAPQWGARLPLEWYFERGELSRTSVRSADGLEEVARPPPVVVTTPADRRSVERTLAGRGVAYRTHRVDLALWGRTVVVFTRERPSTAQ
jgi:uncharacterized protein (TIGR03663 family)